MKTYDAVIAVLVLGFSLVVFGITGFRTVAGALLLFMLPFYLILDLFELKRSEKIAFSFLLGIGLFSAVCYYLGFLFGIRTAIIATFLLLLAVWLLLRKFRAS